MKKTAVVCGGLFYLLAATADVTHASEFEVSVEASQASETTTPSSKKEFVLALEHQVGPWAWEPYKEVTVPLSKDSRLRLTLNFKKQGISLIYALSYSPETMVFWERESDQRSGFFYKGDAPVGAFWTGEIYEDLWWESQKFNLRIHLKEKAPE